MLMSFSRQNKISEGRELLMHLGSYHARACHLLAIWPKTKPN
jgi:hypothetical protein